MCVGCGACAAACPNQAIGLADIEDEGIRPRTEAGRCEACATCLDVCPGWRIFGGTPEAESPIHPLLGAVLGVWQGHAADPEIRRAASSGGLISALALSCIEQEGMAGVVHTGVDASIPWVNRTVESRTRAEILARTGSRYAPASPCEWFRRIESSDRPWVFVGKPCDAEAAALARRTRPTLDRNLGAVLAFFCAGTPSTRGTHEFMRKHGVAPEDARDVRYRGNGWPGRFTVTDRGGRVVASATYRESWHFLQKFRPFRCHLCPDGTGQAADISCGDAWHVHADGDDPGQSLVIARTRRGADIVRRAIERGYVTLSPVPVDAVLQAQRELLARRRIVHGRLLAFRLLGLPAPRPVGIDLRPLWKAASPAERIRAIGGTLKRILRRGLWRRRRLAPS